MIFGILFILFTLCAIGTMTCMFGIVCCIATDRKHETCIAWVYSMFIFFILTIILGTINTIYVFI